MLKIFHKITAGLLVIASFAMTLSACTGFQPKVQTDLDFHVYNPQEKALFPVTSTLITGPNEAILFDAQFQKNDAENLVNMVKASGKKLTTIYISHGDPDYYFGLDVLHASFPEARIVATPATVEKIKKSMQGKKAYWGPILKENAPKELILPEALLTDTLTLDGVEIKIIGFNGHDPLHTFAWIDSEKTVLGGVVLVENMHIWMADNKTSESRDLLIKTLEDMKELQPERIIAGHFLDETSAGINIIDFTSNYIKSFDVMNKITNNASDLINKMKEKYPNLHEEGTLEFSAKVVKGDIQWPK
jgi:glyoxylase-like metal-dependent hydrolase (beta-lactamase superfamily II)